jgi:hypothetical protein
MHTTTSSDTVVTLAPRFPKCQVVTHHIASSSIYCPSVSSEPRTPRRPSHPRGRTYKSNQSRANESSTSYSLLRSLHLYAKTQNVNTRHKPECHFDNLGRHIHFLQWTPGTTQSGKFRICAVDCRRARSHQSSNRVADALRNTNLCKKTQHVATHISPQSTPSSTSTSSPSSPSAAPGTCTSRLCGTSRSCPRPQITALRRKSHTTSWPRATCFSQPSRS